MLKFGCFSLRSCKYKVNRIVNNNNKFQFTSLIAKEPNYKLHIKKYFSTKQHLATYNFDDNEHFDEDEDLEEEYEDLNENLKTNKTKIKPTSIYGDLATDRIRIGTTQLPEELKLRVSKLFKDYPKSWLKRDAEILNNMFKLRTSIKNEKTTDTEFEPLQYNKHQSMAYVAERIDSVYGVATKVFSEIKMRYPEFRPRKVLDFGSGPGTTSWAASQMWSSIRRYLLVEPSESMTDISIQLLEGFPVERRRFLHQGHRDTYDIVICSFSLSDLENDNTRRIHLRSLWEHVAPGGLIVLIEPGNPSGFKIIRQSRTLLLDIGEEGDKFSPKLIAPCPHIHQCPMGGKSWCHFIQRVESSPHLTPQQHRNKNWKNSKFSYLVVSKGDVPAVELDDDHPNKGLEWSRLIRQPLKRGGHVIIDSCNPDGQLSRRIVSKKHGKDIYTAARKSTWGDLFYFDRIKEEENKLRRNWKGHLNK